MTGAAIQRITATATLVPYGWYRVAGEGDLEPGGVRPLRYFGRELVHWRAEDGTHHLQDAICPHLGAHLGYGGSVVGETVVCPFHGWRFDGEGTCAEIPYSERVNRKARLTGYELAEANRMVFAWFHPHGVAPLWEVEQFPEVDHPDFTPYSTGQFTVSAPPSMMGENAADPAHFPIVHDNPVIPTVLSAEADGPRFSIHMAMPLGTSMGDEPAELVVHQYGLGLSTTRFVGVFETLLISTQTPIDALTTDVRFHFTIRRLGTDDETEAFAHLYVDEIRRQVEGDIVIWEHMHRIERPALADVDGPILKYRAWTGQFFQI